MKFSVESVLLAKGVNIVKKAISSSPNAPIFSGLHLIVRDNVLELIAMDLNFSMSTTLPVTEGVDGDVVIPAKQFSDLLSKIEQEVIKVEKNDSANEINIITAKGVFNIPLMDKDEYPPFPQFEGEKNINISEDKLRELIRKTVYACSTDETRPLFTGVLLEKKGQNITCVGTNTHRLAIKTVTIEEEDDSEVKIIIPARLLREIFANTGKEVPEEIEIGLKDRQIQVKIGKTKLISSLIEGNFPDYRRVIPPQFGTKTLFDAQELANAIVRVATFSNDEYKIIRINVENDKLLLSSGISDIGKAREEVECEAKGESLNIAFNSKYILDILKNADSEKLVMEMNNSLSPACIKPVSEDDYLYIVTPVRVIF